MIGIVNASSMWSGGDSRILRSFLLELPPPTRGMDAARTEMDNFYFIFIHHACCALL
jgi:hypothetical protein